MARKLLSEGKDAFADAFKAEKEQAAASGRAEHGGGETRAEKMARQEAAEAARVAREQAEAKVRLLVIMFD